MPHLRFGKWHDIHVFLFKSLKINSGRQLLIPTSRNRPTYVTLVNLTDKSLAWHFLMLLNVQAFLLMQIGIPCQLVRYIKLNCLDLIQSRKESYLFWQVLQFTAGWLCSGVLAKQWGLAGQNTMVPLALLIPVKDSIILLTVYARKSKSCGSAVVFICFEIDGIMPSEIWQKLYSYVSARKT